MQAIHLENQVWQVGILPETGGSVAYSRVRQEQQWVDVLRPTLPENYGRSGDCSSFLMMPWANRIKDGVYHTNDQIFSLRTVADDGTARHGDVRQRPWKVFSFDHTTCTLHFASREHEGVNFPFAFEAELHFSLEGSSFQTTASLKNVDEVAFAAGFGFHPYFVRDAATPPQVQIPCVSHFPLERALPLGPPTKVPDDVDFQRLRSLDHTALDDLFTQRIPGQPARIVFPALQRQLLMQADPLFAHFLLYTPAGASFFALEPQTNANDGFRLFNEGMEGTGVFVLKPQEQQKGGFSLIVQELES